MSDATERVRERLAEVERGIPDHEASCCCVWCDVIKAAVVDFTAALDCLEALWGPEFRCSRCNLGTNLQDAMHLMQHKVHPGLPEPKWLDPHAEAKHEFEEAVCGGK